MRNPSAERPEDRFKVWPTNRDRPAFNEVMAATPPIDYDPLAHRIRSASSAPLFRERAGEWLAAQATNDLTDAGRRVRTDGTRTPSDRRHRPDHRRERAGDLRDTERPGRSAHRRRPDQELRLPAAPGVRSGRRGGVRAELERVRVRLLGDRDQRRSIPLPTFVDLPQPLVDRTNRRRSRRPGGLSAVQSYHRTPGRDAQYSSTRFASRSPLQSLRGRLPRPTGPIDRLGLFAYRTSVLGE